MKENTTRPLSAEERLEWIRLIRSDKVGPITFYKLLERYGTAAAALEALPSLAQRGGAPRFRLHPKDATAREYDALEKAGAKIVAFVEDAYPPLLRHLEDAPPLLFVKGHPHLLSKRAVAVVGARNASVAGRRLAHQFAADLGKGGLLVVSGLARGIDAAAHEGALPTGTVAVVAGGVDVVYPKENAALYDALCAQGAVISEIAIATQPQARHFPRRNRLISGLSRATLVVEASPKSGSLITAKMALEQGRDVFAVPGAPQDPRAQGANQLIRDGAILARSAEDIFEAIHDQISPALKEANHIDFTVENTKIADPVECDEARGELIESLSTTPVSVDELIRNCQFSPASVATALLELEMAGRLERHPGNRVSMLYDT
ncbi:DNA-processing protein DprA [Varunaivibrio sulfuroxidans]|uniref:DNA processing protein n=1 Tax=Varunaivibrio sulfuroxidans TaxID=1773489 RepID=A0A4R3JBR4_9PROT|nr:DNA-processing protein DprA [Varunaivibrio sulfuroxidans]TCS62503.1 DNA processing protein [Varunaivibrio sulfuroxidans]WES30826.1 DNA-processing protein DprA [Varunaivibrio sulfuroxidans]